MNKVILASASPRRKELLKKIVSDFEIIPSNVVETFPSTLDTFQVALYLSNLKAYDIYLKNQDSLVIGVDTIVVINNIILGKPSNKDNAREMLKALSGNMHYVITGVTIYLNHNRYEINSINKVYFKKLTEQEIDSYLENDEYKDKAGSYAIQGIANKFIEKIEGDFDSIVGLPTNELSTLLKKL